MSDTVKTVDEIAKDYFHQVSEIMDVQAMAFLEKNRIPFTNLQETNQLLKDRGYRLIDEVEGEIGEDKKHTLLLVKIVDQTSYVIKAPTFGMK